MYLNDAKQDDHNKGAKEERTKEIEITASLCSPECVQGEAHYHRSR